MVVKEKYYAEYVTQLPDLSSKVVAITGTTSGTGFWAAVGCVRKNVKCLLLLNRTSERVLNAAKLLEEEKEKSGSETVIINVTCDLMSFKSVKEAAEEVKEKAPEGLDVLVNNAGIPNWPDTRTEDGFDATMQVNYLSHFLLTHLLLETLTKKANPRVVTHSSMIRRFIKFDEQFYKKCEEYTLGGNSPAAAMFGRYGQSKIACCLSTTAMAAKFKDIIFVTADPGYSDTPIFAKAKEVARKKHSKQTWGQFFLFIKLMFLFARFVKQSASDGSMPLLHCIAKEIGSGDLVVPQREDLGLPFVAIKAGKPQWKKYKEANILNKADAERAYVLAEDACKDFLK